MRLIIFIFLTTLINVNLSAQEATKEHKDSINTVIAKYYDLHTKMFQAGSKVKDVNN